MDGRNSNGGIVHRRPNVKAVAGVFRTRREAERGAHAATLSGIPKARLNLLTPESSMRKVQEVPVSDTEQPGIGTALGAAVGGTVGVAGGLWLGEALVALLIPGIGPIAAAGVVGAAILGTLGAVGGGAAGGAVDNSLSEGIPGDEIFVYEDALRQGRSVVIALTENKEQAEVARADFKAAGAETIDEARHQWWVGLRGPEKDKYEAAGGKFEQDESFYRQGFEAALHTEHRGQTYEESLDQLRYLFPDYFDKPAFQKGFERGREYLMATKSSILRASRTSA